MNRPSFSSIDFWAEYEKSILLILEESLASLCHTTDETREENDLTVELFKSIAVVRFKRQNKTLADYGSVVQSNSKSTIRGFRRAGK